MATESELAWMLELAADIGERVARGDLPPQDEDGFYLL